MLSVMTDAVPFLSLERKVAYLYERSYFPKGALTAQHEDRLGTLNFHYFLGYARNYRLLVPQRAAGITVADPDDVFRMIDRDHQIAQLLYKGLRHVEWRLRALAVEQYCARFDACGSYLRTTQYLPVRAGSQEEMVRSILGSILRHGEPFVEDHIAERAKAQGRERPKRYEAARHVEIVSYVEDLPLWAVIDSFTLGTLSHFITECDGAKDVSERAWKGVADSLEIRHPVFQSNIESLTVLRNQVSHHARMWMRPSSVTPKKPQVFDKQLRNADSKSMMIGFANLALFHGREDRQSFLDEVYNMVAQDPLYQHGVTKVVSKQKK